MRALPLLLLAGCLEAPTLNFTDAAPVGAVDGTSVDSTPPRDAAAPDAREGDRDGAAPDDAGPADGAAEDGALPDGARPDGPRPDAAADLGPLPDGPPPCEPSPEICNGLDDDCDFVADEGSGGEPLRVPCYEGARNTVRVGRCRQGLATCDQGVLGECVGQVLPTPEVCDSIDQDCDGSADEGLADACGPVELDGVGLCSAGTRGCEAGAPGACVGAVNPGVEICDGEDNDCDGEIDEVEGCGGCELGTRQPCYSGPAGTDGVGRCRPGEQVCGQDGRFGRCEGEVLPAVGEQCDATDDDDCDGTPDEGLAGGLPCAAGVGACRRDGVTVCDPGAQRFVCDAVAADPGPETCDARDDDCDGSADEGFGLGDACAVGVGACRREGTLRCDGAGAAGCDAVPGQARAEACNDRDDDCDGATDEGDAGQPLVEACYTGDPATRSIGRCRDGERVCGQVGCHGQRLPDAEACDGATDEDCDGAVDEGCECRSDDTRPCFSGPLGAADVGVCRSGTQTCIDGEWNQACVGEVLPALVEHCDGRDEDCDGEVDEEAEGTGLPCVVGLGVCRSEGLMVCVAPGELTCDARRIRAEPERCDGLDNDCDGSTDEGLPPVDTPCTVGVGACEASGLLVCDGETGQNVCDAVPLPPRQERCNSRDDDCDGEVDEGWFPSVELCGSGRDEDCDGQIDERPCDDELNPR